MKFKFNGGYGAILCSRCGVILKQGNQIPDYVLDAVQKGTISELPDMYCEDNCERSMKILNSINDGKIGTEKQESLDNG